MRPYDFNPKTSKDENRPRDWSSRRAKKALNRLRKLRKRRNRSRDRRALRRHLG
jgi:hypothetical protein